MKKQTAFRAGGLALVLGCLLISPAAMAVELGGVDTPQLVHGLQHASGKGCRAVRARKPAELKPPWRDAVVSIVLRCEPVEGIDKKRDATTDAVAVLRPGIATLWGVPVVALRQSSSTAHGESQVVLDAPYADAERTLGGYVRARCLSSAATTVAVEGQCTAIVDEGDGSSYTRTSEVGGIWLRPDADDPRRTILVEAWSE